MPNQISKIKIGSTLYQIKDTTYKLASATEAGLIKISAPTSYANNESNSYTNIKKYAVQLQNDGEAYVPVPFGLYTPGIPGSTAAGTTGIAGYLHTDSEGATANDGIAALWSPSTLNSWMEDRIADMLGTTTENVENIEAIIKMLNDGDTATGILSKIREIEGKTYSVNTDGLGSTADGNATTFYVKTGATSSGNVNTSNNPWTIAVTTTQNGNLAVKLGDANATQSGLLSATNHTKLNYAAGVTGGISSYYEDETLVLSWGIGATAIYAIPTTTE